MIVSTEKYLYDSFVLTPGDLQRLAEVFQHFIGRPSYEIECGDGANRRFDDLAGLLSFENGWSRRIRSLWIRSSNDEKLGRARLRFSAEHAPVYLDIAAEAQVAAAIEGAVAGQVEAMRPMYLKRWPLDSALALLAGFAAAVAVFDVVKAPRAFGQAPGGLGMTILLFAGEAVCFGLALMSGWLAHRPISPLFPGADFAVGRGAARTRLLRVLRWALFIGAAGALLGLTFLNIAT